MVEEISEPASEAGAEVSHCSSSWVSFLLRFRTILLDTVAAFNGIVGDTLGVFTLVAALNFVQKLKR